MGVVGASKIKENKTLRKLDSHMNKKDGGTYFEKWRTRYSLELNDTNDHASYKIFCNANVDYIKAIFGATLDIGNYVPFRRVHKKHLKIIFPDKIIFSSKKYAKKNFTQAGTIDDWTILDSGRIAEKIVLDGTI